MNVNSAKTSFSLFLGACLACNAFAALTPRAQEEIDHLLGFVEYSGCEFYRNGAWYDAKRAQAHLRSKYEFRKTSLNAAEDFIDTVASRSSMTGEPYRVKCRLGTPISSEQWLRDELARMRTKPGV